MKKPPIKHNQIVLTKLVKKVSPIISPSSVNFSSLLFIHDSVNIDEILLTNSKPIQRTLILCETTKCISFQLVEINIFSLNFL
jgi:hypothetical protein